MHLVPWLLLAATLLFLAGPRISAWVKRRAAQGKTSRPLLIAGFFLELLIAMYIGYFGAGVGILVLSLLALLGMEDIHAMNGVKLLLVSVVNGVAMVTFILAKKEVDVSPRSRGRRSSSSASTSSAATAVPTTRKK